MKTITATLKQIFTLRWNPNKDVAAVALSWILVVGALYTATAIVGQAVWGGMACFFLYAVVGAALRRRHTVTSVALCGCCSWYRCSRVFAANASN